MSDIIRSNILKQTAVYWADLGTNGRGGSRWSPPVEIKCRWQDGIETVYTNTQSYSTDQNDVQVGNTTIFVDRDLAVGGVLFLGTIQTLLSLSDPRKNPGNLTISKVTKLPNRNASKFLRMVVAK